MEAVSKIYLKLRYYLKLWREKGREKGSAGLIGGGYHNSTRTLHDYSVTISFPETAILLVTSDRKRMGSGDEIEGVMPGDEVVERS